MKKSSTAFSFHGGFTASRYAHIVVMLPKVSSLSPIPHPNICDSVKRWPGFDMLAWHGERSEHWLPPLLSQREQALRPGFSCDSCSQSIRRPDSERGASTKPASRSHQCIC